MASRIRATINLAFASLERAADENGLEACGLFRKAYDAALAGEKAHRRMGAGIGGYRESIDTAARYFVVKWFLDPGKVTDARSAAALRLDCLCASALRAVLLAQHDDFTALRARCEPVSAIDYSDHIAREG